MSSSGRNSRRRRQSYPGPQTQLIILPRTYVVQTFARPVSAPLGRQQPDLGSSAWDLESGDKVGVGWFSVQGSI